jgi:hypothetical protein
MTTVDINEEVQSALPAVLAKLRENIAERVGREAENVALEEVRKATREWAAAVLVPEIKAQLEAGKQGFVTQAAAISNGIANELGKAMLAQVTKTLESGYTCKDIAEKLFRGY